MDRISKYFRGVLVGQIILVLIFGFLIFFNFRNQKLLNVRGLHPFEFNYGMVLPLIIFGISLFICVPLLFSKQQDQETDENEIIKNLRQHNFWKFAFYCNIFFLLIVAVFSIIIFQIETLIVDHVILFYCWVFFRAVLVIVLSLLLASFLLVTGIYWKTNKTMSIVVLALSFIIALISIVSEAGSINEFIDQSESYFTSKNSNGISSDIVVSEESYDEDREENVESKLIFSWDSILKDWGGLEGVKSFQEIRFAIFMSLNELITVNDYSYAFDFAFKLKDNPDEIYSAFEKYNSVLYNSISQQDYRKANFDKVVESLLLTYDDIGEDDEKLRSIYKVMEKPEREDEPSNISDYYPQIEKYFSATTVEAFKNVIFRNKSQLDESDIVWFYSFWARRNHEGNAKEIAIILNEIKEHYTPTSNNDEE